MRNLTLSRDEAELLDELLFEHVKGTGLLGGPIGNIAAQLCEIWGMSYWHHRPDSGFTEDAWRELVKYSEFGHREKSVAR